MFLGGHPDDDAVVSVSHIRRHGPAVGPILSDAESDSMVKAMCQSLPQP